MPSVLLRIRSRSPIFALLHAYMLSNWKGSVQNAGTHTGRIHFAGILSYHRGADTYGLKELSKVTMHLKALELVEEGS